jgi:hypothetical protein
MGMEHEVQSTAATCVNYGKRRLEYSCGYRYLIDHRRVALQYVCPEHEIELICFDG